MTMVRGQSELGQMTETDAVMAEALATVLTGGSSGDPVTLLTEQQVCALEREAVRSVAHRPSTIARIEHMLATGKPLRN